MRLHIFGSYLLNLNLLFAKIFGILNQKKQLKKTCPAFVLRYTEGMKVTTKQSNAILQGAQESKKMTLSEKGIAQATRILRDSIYTHKAWAVVREIVANAVDEHNKHNIEKPVLITLPTADNLNFTVRDYAKGLSTQDVFNVFFQYFESTKNQSNDSIGGFGIGAKSPLAYSDMFFVNSFFNGQKTTYVANIEGEASTAHKMILEDSNETGIEVSIPVLEKDIPHFKDLVNHLLSFGSFNVKVHGLDEVKNGSSFDFTGNHGQVGKVESLFPSPCHTYVRIKGILYPVHSSSEIKNPFQYGSILDFSGEDGIQIHPSRESIELSKRNIVKVNQKFELLKNEALKEYLVKAEKANNARDLFAIKKNAAMFKDTSTIKNAAGKNVIVEQLNVQATKSFHLGWDEKSFTKTLLANFIRYNARHDTFNFRPGQLIHSSYWSVDQHADKKKSEIILCDKPTFPSYEKFIAFAEKVGLKNKAFVLNCANAPEGWVEGEDFWKYDESLVSKDEAKEVRGRYRSTSTSRSQSNQSKNEILCYSTSKRNDASKMYESDLKKITSSKIMLVPMNAPFNQIDLCELMNHYCPTYRFLFYFESKLQALKDSGLKFEMFNLEKIEGILKKYHYDRYRPENMEWFVKTFLWRENCDKYGLNRHETISYNLKVTLQKVFPNFIPPINKSRIRQWKKAEARYQKLTKIEKLLLEARTKMSFDYYVPELDSEIKKIAQKVLV